MPAALALLRYPLMDNDVLIALINGTVALFAALTLFDDRNKQFQTLAAPEEFLIAASLVLVPFALARAAIALRGIRLWRRQTIDWDNPPWSRPNPQDRRHRGPETPHPRKINQRPLFSGEQPLKDHDQPSPTPETPDYPGFSPEAQAAANLAAAAVKLALYEHGLEALANAPADPIAQALSYYALLTEEGWSPEEAAVQLILFQYFDAAGKAIAQEMGADFDEHVSRFVTVALMEYLESRMKAPEDALEEIYPEPADPPGPSTACWKQEAG